MFVSLSVFLQYPSCSKQFHVSIYHKIVLLFQLFVGLAFIVFLYIKLPIILPLSFHDFAFWTMYIYIYMNCMYYYYYYYSFYISYGLIYSSSTLHWGLPFVVAHSRCATIVDPPTKHIPMLIHFCSSVHPLTFFTYFTCLCTSIHHFSKFIYVWIYVYIHITVIYIYICIHIFDVYTCTHKIQTQIHTSTSTSTYIILIYIYILILIYII